MSRLPLAGLLFVACSLILLSCGGWFAEENEARPDSYLDDFSAAFSRSDPMNVRTQRFTVLMTGGSKEGAPLRGEDHENI